MPKIIDLDIWCRILAQIAEGHNLSTVLTKPGMLWPQHTLHPPLYERQHLIALLHQTHHKKTNKKLIDN